LIKLGYSCDTRLPAGFFKSTKYCPKRPGQTTSSLVESIERRLRNLDLATGPARERADLTAMTAYVTTLAMNYLVRGEFIATEEE